MGDRLLRSTTTTKIDPMLTSEEIRRNISSSNNLSPIPKKGGFISTDAYLSNHYHLFREGKMLFTYEIISLLFADFMRDVRSALNLIVTQRALPPNELLQEIKDTFYVYTNVLTENIKFTPKEALISLNAIPQFLNKSKIGEKQLMKGSLLILTDEHFSEFQFLTVFGLPPKNNIFLKKHKRILLAADIGITLMCGGDQAIDKIKSIFKLGSTGNAILLECKSYWQGCYPFLNSIQSMMNLRINLPFSNAIVFPENYKNQCPSFINNGTEYMIKVGYREKKVQILGDWQNLDLGTLDKSQQKCLKHMITNQLSLIQGPPGTGKSFVGSTLIKVLLDNKQIWSPQSQNPILIVCKSNHALDSFILSIEKHTSNIARMGRRFKDSRVEKYCLDNIKKQFLEKGNKLYTDSFRDLKKAFSSIEDQYQEFIKMSQDAEFIRPLLSESVIDLLDSLKSKVDKDFANYFSIQIGINRVSQVFDMWWKGEIQTDLFKNKYFTSSANDWNKKNDPKKEQIFNCNEEQGSDEEDDENEEIEEINNKEADNGNQQLSWMLHQIKGNVMSCNEDIFNSIWNQNRNIFSLDYAQSQIIKSFFVQQAYKNKENYLNFSLERYIPLITKNQEENDQNTSTILSSKDVVCMTLNGAAMSIGVIQKLQPPIIIVEEAGEVLESILIPLLGPSLKQLILIGDHQQLKPLTINHELTQKYNYDTSLLERLIHNGINYTSLSTQRRMRPELADYIRLIYKNYEDHEDVKSFPNVKGILSNIYLINHNKLEDSQKKNSQSKTNSHEANYALKMAAYFIRIGQFKENQITILSMYLKQVQLIKKLANQMDLKELQIKTVDNYQGEENEIVILSLVRSNPEGKLGFVNVENRINVAFSRARKGFYCLGNFDMMKKSNNLSPLWKKVINFAEQKNQIIRELFLICKLHNQGKVVNPHDFDKIKKYELCQSSILPPCGHEPYIQCCKLKEYNCKAQVKFQCPDCKSEKLQIKLCYQSPSSQYCENERSKMLQCGHSVQVKCKNYDQTYTCIKQVQYKCRSSNHILNRLCYEQPQIFCDNLIDKLLPCKHKISITCSQNYKHSQLSPQEQQRNQFFCNQQVKIECIYCNSPKLLDIACTYSQFIKNNVNIINLIQQKPALSNLKQAFNQCVNLVYKTLPQCKHPKKMQCNQQPGLNESCDWEGQVQLKCDHYYQKKCSDQVPLQYKCTKSCFIVCSSCSYFNTVKCHERENYQCKNIIWKRFAGKNPIQNECLKFQSKQ